jgi:DNA end-binding protein Ku
VKLFAAVQNVDVHFHILQNKTKSRVKQEMVTEEGRQKVEKEQVRKGYEVEPGTFVIVEPRELQQLQPKDDRLINIARFVPPGALGNAWYERPYYLGPDGDVEQYFALAEALENRKLVGIARWSMRGKSYVGAVRTEEGYLTLIKLRYAEEILSTDDLPAPGGRALEQKELKMAEELMAALKGKFEPGDFRDEYRKRVTEFVQAKASGKHPRLPQIRERRVEGSLDQQLAKSLIAMKSRRERKVA